MRKRDESGELYTITPYQNQTCEQKPSDQPENQKSLSCMMADEGHESQDSMFAHLPLTIQAITEGIFLIDAKGIIQYCNQPCLHLFGYDSPSELEGLHISNLLTNESFPLFDKDHQQTELDRGGFLSQYQAKKKDGTIIWIDGISCRVSFERKPAHLFFIRDISGLRNTLESLEQLEKKYRTIADLSANGIVTLDPLGKITYTNKSFAQMTKKQNHELTNTLFREFLTEDSIYQFQQLLLEVRKKKENKKHVELYLEVETKDYIPIELSIAPVFEKDSFTGYICTILDIKERKQFEDEIKKSERLKTEFMNIVAHELKSPVTPIKGYLDLIRSDQNTDERIKKWAHIGLRNAERLLLLVDDILDVSRLDNDTMSFEMKRINLTGLFDEIIEDMTPSLNEKHLTFHVDIQSGLPDILGDYHRLNQVFRNLFTNAIKFTDSGSITLQAYAHDHNLVVKIADTGIGMRKDEVNHVFRKFFQAETSAARKHEGTGLGLFICKEIIKKHHGDIKVNSEMGKGSTFTIVLPTL